MVVSTAQVLFVNVGGVRAVDVGDRTIKTAIWKSPVEGRVPVRGVNVSGDDQADRSVHGGPDKAVYVYSADHFAAWTAELGMEVGPATFGENLTVVGVTERDVCIGDRWSWGDALLEVCQPRWPCFKLTIRTGVRDIGHRLRASGRTGWYLRVIEPGTVPVSGPLAVDVRDPAGVSVHEAHLAQADRHRDDPERIARVLAVAALADEWRIPLED